MSNRSLKDWFFRSTILPQKKILVFLLGFLAAALFLACGLLEEKSVARAFGFAFVLCLVVLLIVRPHPFRDIIFDKSRWGIFSIAVLGFGSGALLFHYRGWLAWLWLQLLKINTDTKVLLASLFLLGVIMGFFVVRNWSKDQKDFLASLSAVLGGAFLSSVIGEFAQDGMGGTAKWITFTYYFWGFTLSGAINLLAFTFLTARYTSNQSAISRAIIDLLYGSDKAKAIDAYFLRNFEDDLDYAKSALLRTLRAYREIIRDQLARKFQAQRSGQPNKTYCLLLSIEQIVPAAAGTAPVAPGIVPATPGTTTPVAPTTTPVAPGTAPAAGVTPATAPRDSEDQFVVRFRTLGPGDEIKPEMFRVSVSMRWQDNLEYVVAPGEYRKSFPYFGSVAGLALLSRTTIVMDRDKWKKFRSEQYTSGKTPAEIRQGRGLGQIDYVSYIAIPLVINFGRQEETELGILHVDTKLFAEKLANAKEEIPGSGVYRVTRSRQDLEDELGTLGNKIYADVEDENIKFLEGMRGVIIPVLQLYKKCRTGAAKPDSAPAAQSS